MDLLLKQGATFSLLEGPETGRLLLMIHGATVPHWEFDRTRTSFAQGQLANTPYGSLWPWSFCSS